MMRWLIESSLRLHVLIAIVAVVLLAVGVVQLQNMPVDVFPEFDPPLVEVQTEALGLSATEVESLITVPTEADLLNGVAWLDRLYSESVTGLSSILLVFEPGTDPIKARQMVAERLTQAFALPNVSKPPTMLQPLSSTNRVMMVGLSSQELTPIELGVLAQWSITPRLLGVPGVANVAVWGQRERQLQVQVEPDVLQEKGVSLKQVIETAGEALWVSPLSFLEASSPGTAGWIDTPNQRLTIRHLLPISSAEDLAKVAVEGTDGLLLGDVANVVEDHQPLIGDAALESGPGLIVVVEKFPGANTLEVTRGIEDAFAAMAPGLSGVEIDTTVFRPANYIEQVTANLSMTLLYGAILALLVLLLFLWNWRTVLIAALVIPMSLVAATYVLYLRGASFNTMVLAGLAMALAVIIDDAVSDVENVARRVRQHRQGGSDKSTASVVLEASTEMRSPAVYATLILLLAVLPLFFIEGLAGAYFQPLVVSYLLALLASMVVALLVTPALTMLLLGKASFGKRGSPLAQGLQSAYRSILSRTVQSPYAALVVAAVFIVAGLAMLPLLRSSLTPSYKASDLLIQWDGTPGTSGTEMNRVMAQASAELRSIPGVRNVGSSVGRAVTGDQIVGINSGELWVSLDPAADHDDTLAAVQEVVDGYPGLQRDVQAYQPRRTVEALTQPQDDVVVRLYGTEWNDLHAKAQEIAQAVSGISGVTSVNTAALTEEPQVEIEVNLDAAEKYGVKPGDVRRQATTYISGLQVGNLFEEQKVFGVVVWGVPELRNSLTNLRDLKIETAKGLVPLGELADVRIAPVPVVIKRDTVSRFIDVGAQVAGRSLAAVTADIKASLQNVEFPLEFHAEVMGASAEQQAARQRLILLVVMAVVGTLLLLQAAYRSWSLAFFVLLTLPMALAGGMLAAYLGGGVLTLGSLVGLMIVLGIAVRNNAVMTTHLENLETREGQTFGRDLVLAGASNRVVPILTTALATAAALLPFIFLGDVAGHEIARPIAIVVLGGLVTSTLLNLFVLPALYLRFGARREVEVEAPAFEPPAELGMAQP